MGSVALSWDRLKWDEASHRFSMLVVYGGVRHTGTQTSRRWQLCRIRWLVGWQKADGSVHAIEIIFTPVMCVGSLTASAVENALYHSRIGREGKAFVDHILRLTSRHLCLRECDQASPNVKFLAWEERSAPSRMLFSSTTCLMHGAQHVVEGRCGSLVLSPWVACLGHRLGDWSVLLEAY